MSILQAITSGQFLAILGAAAAVFLSCMGSAKGVGIAGEAAGGLVTEDPGKFGQCLLLQALPGTNGIYGMLTAFVIMTQIGILGGAAIDVPERGLLYFAASLPIAVVGYFAGIYQGRVAAVGIGLIAKQPQELSKAIVFTAMIETYCILALLASILLVLNI